MKVYSIKTQNILIQNNSEGRDRQMLCIFESDSSLVKYVCFGIVGQVGCHPIVSVFEV